MNNIAIIPARGGSKRIPRKNIRDFLGKPIISYSIETAIQSGLFKEVMVSTDDEEISNVALQYGANIPFFRSSENSNDFSTTFDVIEEVINSYNKIGDTFDNICCIYPCAPFCSISNLKETYALLTDRGFDTVFPVVQYSTPIQRALSVMNDKVSIINSNFQNFRSQDLVPSFFDAGQFYWINNDVVFNQKIMFTDNSGCITIDELNAHDIDNEIDWKIAELKYRFLNNYGN
uniref:pseudaminic acid cytidylyltransferase n=1 Tax=Flavobacterium sp. TaxID=239 RepID=UPI00404964CF